MGAINLNWRVAHPEHNNNIHFIILSLARNNLIQFSRNPHVFTFTD